MRLTSEWAVDLCLESAPSVASRSEALFRLRACALLLNVQVDICFELSLHLDLLLNLKLISVLHDLTHKTFHSHAFFMMYEVMNSNLRLAF